MTSPVTALIADRMAVQMARLLAGAESVFHGLASPLPAVAIRLARELHAPDVVYLNIAGGVNAAPAALTSSTCDPTFLDGSESYFSLIDIFDLSARGRLDVAFLGGVQIDVSGAINNSVIGDFARPKVRLPGGAGSAAIVPTARRTIVWRTRHDARSLVERVDFGTARGNVDAVVTPLGLFRRDDEGLWLAGWFAGTSPDEIRQHTGFAIRLHPESAEIADPTDAELAALNRVDPTRTRDAEF